MLAVYLAALAFGLILIGASAFSGDGDAHGDAHAGETGAGDAHDDAHAADVPHGALVSNLVSLRFWTYALGAFGMTGTALHFLKVPPAAHVPLAAGMGLLVGGATAWLFRKLRTAAASSPASEEGFLGREAEVVLSLLPEKLGKIRLRIGEQDVELPARGGEEDRLDTRSKVIVVRFRDGVAEVRPAPWKE